METYHSLGLDLAALQVLDRSGEAEGLREGTNDLPIFSNGSGGGWGGNIP